MKTMLNKSAFKLLFYTLLISTISACSKNISYDPDVTKNPVNEEELAKLDKVVPKNTVVFNLEGIITDEEGLPLSGVIVKAGSNVETTDSEGKFKFFDITLNANYAVVKVSKTGFFDGFRTFAPTAGGFNKIEIALLSKGIAKSLDSETGGSLEFEDGKVKLDFPANILTDQDGNLFTGNAQIRARYIDPQADNFGEIMPGTLTGLDEDEQITAMISYGMISVEMTDASGNKLEISGNKEVEVEMPAILDAPVEMPIWHFNETFGLWVEAGVAAKVGEKYVFKANTFSSWNLDFPLSTIEQVELQFVNQVSVSLANQNICIFDLNNNLLRCVYSDNQGKIKLNRTPQNMIFKITTVCGGSLSKSFTVGGSTGTVVLDDSEVPGRIYKLTGKIEDCEGVIANKLITFSGNDGIFFQGKTNADGTFEVNSILCEIDEDTEYDILIRAFTSSSSVKQFNTTIEFEGGSKELELDFCGTLEESPFLNPTLTYGQVTDIDGNVYATIQIGTQTWMAQNLKTTRYKDGTEIPNVTEGSQWITGAAAWCYYENNAANDTIYGKLYNWAAVNTGKLCPNGWHIPTDAEWTILSTFLGGDVSAGGKLKSTLGWESPNTGATNESGFSALPGGRRLSNEITSSFDSKFFTGYWWSSSINGSFSWHRNITNSSSNSNRMSGLRQTGMSCRCIKD